MSEGAHTRRWTQKEYDRLIEIGVFQPDESLELLGGELIVGEPQSSPHYTAIGLVEEALRAVLGPGWLVRPHGPVALDEEITARSTQRARCSSSRFHSPG